MLAALLLGGCASAGAPIEASWSLVMIANCRRQPPFSAGFDADRVEQSQAHASAVFMSTVNDPEDLRAAALTGADGVSTDRPDLARQIFDEPAEASR